MVFYERNKNLQNKALDALQKWFIEKISAEMQPISYKRPPPKLHATFNSSTFWGDHKMSTMLEFAARLDEKFNALID